MRRLTKMTGLVTTERYQCVPNHSRKNSKTKDDIKNIEFEANSKLLNNNSKSKNRKHIPKRKSKLQKLIRV